MIILMILLGIMVVYGLVITLAIVFDFIVLWIILWILVGIAALLGLVVTLVFVLIIVLCLGRIQYHVDAQVGGDTRVEIKYLMRLVYFVATYKEGKYDSQIRIAWYKPGMAKPRKAEKQEKGADLPQDAHEENNIADLLKDVEKHYDNTASFTSSPLGSEKEKKDRLKPFKQAKSILTYPDRKIIIGLCFQCMFKFLKALKPKLLDISGVIGFEDPYNTGLFMGAYEATIGIMQLRHKIRILGSYHEKALMLNIKAKGRACLWRLIWPFIWLYLHKPIRVVIHEHILRKGD